jgi:hypothetical protein
MENKILYYVFLVLSILSICYYKVKYGQFNDTTLIIGLVLLGFIITNMHKFKSIEGLDNIENFDNGEALANIASIYNAGKLKVTDLEVTGKATIANGLTASGGLTVNGGSSFNGGRHYFQDEENAGRLRVGGAWGIPGIYAEDGKALIVGASNKNIHIRDAVLNAENGSRFSGDRHLFKDSENAGWLRVGAAYGRPGIFAEDGGELSVQYMRTGRFNPTGQGNLMDGGATDYIKSRTNSYALMNTNNTGIWGMAHDPDKRLYTRYLQRGNHVYGGAVRDDNLAV